MESASVNGVTIPKIGLGAARMTGRTCEQAVTQAVELGYRHVDTAQMYDNEKAVDDGIDAARVDRAEIFVTTKLDSGNRSREAALS